MGVGVGVGVSVAVGVDGAGEGASVAVAVAVGRAVGAATNGNSAEHATVVVRARPSHSQFQRCAVVKQT